MTQIHTETYRHTHRRERKNTNTEECVTVKHFTNRENCYAISFFLVFVYAPSHAFIYGNQIKVNTCLYVFEEKPDLLKQGLRSQAARE